MRIACDLRSLAGNRYSGVEEYTRSLLSALLPQAPDHEFVFYFNAFKGEAPLTELATQFPNRVRYVHTRWPSKILHGGMTVLGQPTVDYFTGPVDAFFSPNLLFRALRPTTPHVITFHDLSFALNPEYYPAQGRIWHRMVQPRKVAHEAARIIAVSEATKNDLVALYDVDPGKISVIHSGIAETQPPTATELTAVQKKYDLPAHFVLVFGTREPRKNIAGVLQAYRQYLKATENPADLVIAGSMGWLHRDVEQGPLMRELGERVHCIGFIDQSDKAALFHLADLAVFASFYEGFGFPPLEAMQQDMPVVASHTSAIPEILDAAALLVDPYDTAALAWALREGTNNQVLREKLIQRGRAIVSRMRWHDTAAQTLAVFESLTQK